jgi:hypothetical protein
VLPPAHPTSSTAKSKRSRVFVFGCGLMTLIAIPLRMIQLCDYRREGYQRLIIHRHSDLLIEFRNLSETTLTQSRVATPLETPGNHAWGVSPG